MKRTIILQLLGMILTCLTLIRCNGIKQTSLPVAIYTNQYPDIDFEAFKYPLTRLVSDADTSLECAFSDLDAGFSQELDSLNNSARRSIRNLASQILEQKKRGIKMSVVFDARRQCTSPGALYLAYPSLFGENPENPAAYKDIVVNCENVISTDDTGATPDGLPVDSTLILPTGLIEYANEIAFARNSDAMNTNFCIADGHKIWFSLGPLSEAAKLPALSFIIESSVNADPGTGKTLLAEEFIAEFNMIKSGLSGKLKIPMSIPLEHNIRNSTWKILRGPQDNPLEALSSAINNSASIIAFSTDMPYAVSGAGTENNFKVQNSLLNKIKSGSDVRMIFSGSHIFSKGSFVQQNILSADVCRALPEFCANSLHFLKNRGTSRFPYHFFLLTGSDGIQKTIVYSGALDKNLEKNSDSIFIEIESEEIYHVIFDFWEKVRNSAENLYGTDSMPAIGEIAINEIIWMGSVDNLGKRKSNDEAIELVNNSDHKINLSGITVACTNSPLGDSVSGIFSIPEGVIISPDQFFVAASIQHGAFAEADIHIPDLSISNSSRECLIIDNRQPADFFYPSGSKSGHYSNSMLTGRIIDRVLDFSGAAWNSEASKYFSRTGYNSPGAGGIFPPEGKFIDTGSEIRSMEKVSPDADGALLKNWHINTRSPGTGADNHLPEYVLYTMTSAGSANSPAFAPANSSVVINELHWMGSYDDYGMANAGDEFVEFFNTSNHVQNIGGWIFGCSTDTAGVEGSPGFAFPPGTAIEPGQYLVVRNNRASTFINYDFTFDFNLNNNITQCLLADGNPAAQFFLGQNSSPGSLPGHYNNPLFVGAIVDLVSDRSATLAALNLGLNDTANLIRKSCERVDANLPGNISGNWKTNSTPNPDFNIHIKVPYRSNTFATPGAENSK